MANRIVIKTTGIRSGRMTIDEKIVKVRIDDESYRNPTDDNLNKAILWIMNKGFELEKKVAPKTGYGTIETTYIYVKPQLTKTESMVQ